MAGSSEARVHAAQVVLRPGVAMDAAGQRDAAAVVDASGDPAGLLRLERSQRQQDKRRRKGEPTESWGVIG